MRKTETLEGASAWYRRLALLPLLLALLATHMGTPVVGQLPGSLPGNLRLDRIEIRSDDDFTAANGVVGGKGTSSDPYRIQGWNFVENYPDAKNWMLVVSNTSAHVVIAENTFVSAFAWSVSVNNATNVTISDNQFIDAGQGVKVVNSPGIVVEGNVFTAHDDFTIVTWAILAIVIEETARPEVRGNVVDGYFAAVTVRDSPESRIHENVGHNLGPGGAGIIVRQSPGTWVAQNILECCSAGIHVRSDHVVVEANVVRDMGGGDAISAEVIDRETLHFIPIRNVTIVGNSVENVYTPFYVRCGDCLVAFNDFVGWDGPIGGARLKTCCQTLPGSTTIANNLFAGAGGSLDFGGNITLLNNNLEATGTPLAEAGWPVDLRSNWWGDEGGPSKGQIEGNASFSPWLTERVEDAGVEAWKQGARYESPRAATQGQEERPTPQSTIGGSDAPPDDEENLSTPSASIVTSAALIVALAAALPARRRR